ncbi:hypothetical protein COCCADRAFT_102964, partial [Bipolaris zeicola 26-R-13]
LCICWAPQACWAMEAFCCQNRVSSLTNAFLTIRSIRKNAIDRVEVTVCSRVTGRDGTSYPAHQRSPSLYKDLQSST